MSFNIVHSNFNTIDAMDFDRLLSLRYQVFKERLGWEVPTKGQFESDQYDNANAEYLFAKDENQQVVGCWRLISTTQDYMLKNTFPQLLGNEPAPSGKHIVELSRFAVQKNTVGMSSSISDVTFKMLQAVYLHAVERGIEEYVTVTSTSIERFLKRIGIPCKRIGDQKVHVLGDTKSIVLSVPVNQDFRKAVLN